MTLREPDEIPTEGLSEVIPPGVFPGDASDGAQVCAQPASTPEAAQHGWRLLGVLSALMGFASISTDLYLPAMPDMGRALAASDGAVEWTVSSYLVGFSLGQLLWGPIGDRFGRRLPVAAGIFLFVLGSAGCALASNIEAMIACRVLQAVGACAGVVLARAMVRDLYSGDRAAQMLSTLMTVMAIAPLIGPLVGGQILVIASWRAIFWALVGVGTLTLLALCTLPETLPTSRRNAEPMRIALSRYGALIIDRRLVGPALAGGFFYAGVYAYIAGSPFAYISYHHVAPQAYGWLFGTGIVGIMLANVVNARLVSRFGRHTLLNVGAALAAISGIALALFALTDFGGVYGLVAPLFLFCGANGFIVANSLATALDDFPDRAGAVSALVGTVHYGSGILGSALVGLGFNGTPVPMALVIAASGIGCLVCAAAIALSQRRSTKISN